MAQPILCEGLEERYPLRYPDPQPQFSLHSVLQVAQLEEEGPVSLKPGILTSGSGSYEIESFPSESGARLSWLLLNMPEAFAVPKTIATDALWYQPWFSETALSSQLEANLYDRHIEGVTWDIVGEIQSHAENPLREDMDGMLQILALQKKTFLTLDELRCVLKALGTLKKSQFHDLVELLVKLNVEVLPNNKISGGFIYAYQVQFKEFDPSYQPRVEIFLKKIVQLLMLFVQKARRP